MSRFFYNDRQHLVSDAIEGIIISTPHQNLERLDIDPAIRIVARKDWDKRRVALISGGGAGHEPAHAGFVGKGMLTAAVCGDLFASPSVDAVYQAIMALTGDAGCLLIVKNYTGDRLNFGLAAEKAKKAGLKVEMVIVGDDISLPENKQPRGIAGTILIHKIAGYAAEQGQSLEEVLNAAQQACANLASIGVAIQTCHLPDDDGDQQRITQGQAELGLGIHGEPGAETVDTQNSQQLIARMIARLGQTVGDNAELAVLINNLGGTSALEMAVLTKTLVHSTMGSQIKALIGPAALVTALDMKGFSLSVIRLSPSIQQALAAPVETAGWLPLVMLAPAASRPVTAVDNKHQITPSANPQVQRCVATVTQTLIDNESYLNQLDAKVGDGDTGSTFAQGARDIAQLNLEEQLPLNDVASLCALVGERLATVMGGSSGVLMSIFFTAAGQKIAEGEPLTQALLTGLAQMKHYGGARLGDRTLVDALEPALNALQSGTLQQAADAASQGAEKTASMRKAGAGRASYVNSDNLNGVVDPGAAAVAAVFMALANE